MIFLNKDIQFPDPRQTDADGLLAIGGDLSPQRLILAYSSGIFPWFSDEGMVYWFSPPRRLVLLPGDLRISHSMKQIIHSKKFKVTEDQAFEDVIRNCALVHLKNRVAPGSVRIHFSLCSNAPARTCTLN